MGPETQTPEPQTNAPELTFGQKAAGVTFNPSKDHYVDAVKRLTAQLIDACNTLRESSSGEKARYFSKAISHFEDGQMNAVKAITWQH